MDYLAQLEEKFGIWIAEWYDIFLADAIDIIRNTDIGSAIEDDPEYYSHLSYEYFIDAYHSDITEYIEKYNIYQDE